MDYEKKYKEALGWMQSLYKGLHGATKEDAEHYFPELKMSEDEKIKKEIVDFITSSNKYGTNKRCEAWLNWLEKQSNEPKVSYTTIVETGNGGINALVTKELLTNGCDDEQKHSIDINKMVNDYANSSERGNEEFGKPVPCMIRAYRQGLNDAIGKVVRKPWSEEDEVKINRIVACLENLNVADNDILLKDVDWLKSFKDRIQQKQEWSREDEAHINGIIDYLLDYKLLVYEEDMNVANGVQKELDWLESIKE